MIIPEGTFTRSSTPGASSPLSHSIQSGETLDTGPQHIVDGPSNLRDIEHIRPALHTRASVSDVDPMGDMDRGRHKLGPRHSLRDARPATRAVWNTTPTTKHSLVDLDKPLPPLPEYDRVSLADADARLQTDGRLQISFNRRFTRQFPDSYGEPVQELGIDSTGFKDAPQMNVNIMIVGSRGDVQPYLAFGQKLQEYGHTVRLSTHETFRELVKSAGLRFFSIGGDPHELMSYMVRNPGLMPGFESLKNGDIGKKQSMVAEILEGCYQSCFAPDAEQDGGALFTADAIISNPPTFAHIHCAEALGIPLLLSFTMPWCATAAFPHPLVNVKHNPKDEPRLVNYYSYGLVDIMTWQGLGRTINKFRMKRLGLSYLNTQSAVGMLERCAVPWTYCLSPALVPKPADWMDNIDVVGFYFLDLAKEYTPPKDLDDFLAAGEPPIYVGFGSIVLDNPEQITKSFLEAISLCGVRALISPGWGGLDKAMIESAGPNIFALGNVPHDWLFERVSAVCHHGGAGTTAIGLRCGKPTIIIPFFGDQPWWASQIVRRGAGPPPIYHKQLTAESLAAAIRIALSSGTKEAAIVIGNIIKGEEGTKNGLDSFHRHLPLLNMRCNIDPSRVAVWYSPRLKLRLSAFAAQVLVEQGKLDLNGLELYRSREYHTHMTATDPVTGAIAPSLKTINDITRGIAKIPSRRPDKGMAQMVGGYVLGAQAIIQGLTEGVHNTPKLYGGRVRELGRVKGVGSGLLEGGKALGLGMYDGCIDVVREPTRRYMESGILGGVAGAAIGGRFCKESQFTNLFFKPVAGAMAAISLPLEGTAKNVQALFHKKTTTQQHATRYMEGLVEARKAAQSERDAVVKTFEEYNIRRSVDKKGKGREIFEETLAALKRG
ncbi:glycosyltransferase family 1 protein [Ceratobasidium sp. AG-Ba]|nr:glycosyltransferase family 1 protein [Ceratobasidium sp. AG-Ba]